MRKSVLVVVASLLCLVVGLLIGAWQSESLRISAAGQWVSARCAPMLAFTHSADSPFESYAYPTIKWRPKALSDGPDSVVRLWTTFERSGNDQPGTMKYKLTLFKATNKNSREVQLLDSMGFKILQFNGSDFHDLPGAPDIVEARDSVQLPEDQYKKMRDYSVK